MRESQTSLGPHHTKRTRHLGLTIDLVTILDQLRNHRDRFLPRQPTEIHRRLRMSRSRPHTSLTRLQRDDMSGSTKHIPVDFRIREPSTRQTAVLRADARGGTFAGVDGDGVRRAVGVEVVRDHLRQLEARGERRRDGRAQIPRRMPDHPRGFRRREVARRDDQIAFVLAVGGVEDHDEFAVG